MLGWHADPVSRSSEPRGRAPSGALDPPPPAPNEVSDQNALLGVGAAAARACDKPVHEGGSARRLWRRRRSALHGRTSVDMKSQQWRRSPIIGRYRALEQSPHHPSWLRCIQVVAVSLLARQREPADSRPGQLKPNRRWTGGTTSMAAIAKATVVAARPPAGWVDEKPPRLLLVNVTAAACSWWWPRPSHPSKCLWTAGFHGSWST